MGIRDTTWGGEETEKDTTGETEEPTPSEVAVFAGRSESPEYLVAMGHRVAMLAESYASRTEGDSPLDDVVFMASLPDPENRHNATPHVDEYSLVHDYPPYATTEMELSAVDKAEKLSIK